MTDVKDASMENQFIHTRGMICQSEAKEKTLAVTLSDADINGRKKKLLLYMEKDAPVAVGDDIEVRGILEKPERASNPGQFDGASYYRSKGIAYIMRPDGYTIVGKGILAADFFNDLHVGAVHCTQCNGTVQHEFHVACTGSFLAGC